MEIGSKQGSGIGRNFGCDTWVNRGRFARIVDDVADFAEIAKSNRNHVVKLHIRRLWDLNRARQDNAGMKKDAIYSKAPRFMAGDTVRNFVGGPAVGSGSTSVTGLAGRVVRDLGLIEISPAVVSIPEHLKLLVMFHEQTVHGDVVSVNDKAVGAGIAQPAHAGPVIGAPDPGVIDDGVAAVDFEIDYRAAYPGPANAEENVVQ